MKKFVAVITWEYFGKYPCSQVVRVNAQNSISATAKARRYAETILGLIYYDVCIDSLTVEKARAIEDLHWVLSQMWDYLTPADLPMFHALAPFWKVACFEDAPAEFVAK